MKIIHYIMENCRSSIWWRIVIHSFFSTFQLVIHHENSNTQNERMLSLWYV